MDIRSHLLLPRRTSRWYGFSSYMRHILTRISVDKTGERFFHICVPVWGVIIGYIIAMSTMSVAGRYVALFLMASGRAGMMSRIYALRFGM